MCGADFTHAQRFFDSGADCRRPRCLRRFCEFLRGHHQRFDSSVGASQAEAASGLMILSLSMGICGISPQPEDPHADQHCITGRRRLRLATTGGSQVAFSTAVGAFIVTAAC